jgi:type I restriction enzyme S subunit
MSSKKHQPSVASSYPRGFSSATSWQWPLVPARELLKLNYGKALKAEVRHPGAVPVYGTNGQCGWHDIPLTKGPGLILGRKGQGPLGVEWCDDDFWVIDTAYYATTGRSDVELKYLYHLIRYVGLNHLKDGTSNPTLAREVFGSQLFPLPSADVQRSIVDVLQNFDDRITLLRETNATLEAIAQALFKSWFVDFDPVRAKMAGRAPGGIDEATAELFPDSLEESESGVVPSGWQLCGLGRLINLTKGCSYKGEGLSEAHGAYMFNLGCFNAHRVYASEKVKRYTGEYRPRHAVEAGDLIIANTDMTQARDILGRPAFVPDGLRPGFISHHVYKATVLPEWADFAPAVRSFLFFALQQPGFRERAIGFATGTTVLALPTAAVLDSVTPLPSTELLTAFGRIVKPLFDTIAANEQRAATLTVLRDTLLPRLISGQLRLPEALAEVTA